MARKRINPRLAKLHRSYTVEEAARTLDVHKNTVRGWIKKGLPIADKSRPTLILGGELRQWLEKQSKARKRPCPPGTFRCFKCREPRAPALGMVEYQAFNSKSGNLKALCCSCDTMMHRCTGKDKIAAVMPGLDVQMTEAPPSILERVELSLNCDKQKE